MPADMVEGGVSTANGNASNGHGTLLDRAPQPAPSQSLPGERAPQVRTTTPWVRGAWESFRVLLMLLGGHVVTVVALALLLFPEYVVSPEVVKEPLPLHFALLISCAVGILPPLLARICYGLMNKRAAQRQVKPRFPRQLPPALVQAAHSAWHYECRRAEASLTRAEAFAVLWGLVTTVSLASALTFLVPPLHLYSRPFSEGRQLLALTVVAAVATRFLLDLGRICVRNANDDLSRRVFADAVNRLLLTLVATLAFALVAGPEPSAAPLADALRALGLGIAVAMVGMPAFTYAMQRASTLLGIKTSEQPAVLPLTTLVGAHAEELERLREEGIDSIECLVSTPLPRIFLNTRFSLPRICDWFDRALLLRRLGPSATAELQQRAGIIGARELCRFAADESDSTAVLIALLQRALRLESAAEAQLVLSALAADETVRSMDVFSQTLVEIVDVEQGETDGSARTPVLAS